MRTDIKNIIIFSITAVFILIPLFLCLSNIYEYDNDTFILRYIIKELRAHDTVGDVRYLIPLLRVQYAVQLSSPVVFNNDNVNIGYALGLLEGGEPGQTISPVIKITESVFHRTRWRLDRLSLFIQDIIFYFRDNVPAAQNSSDGSKKEVFQDNILIKEMEQIGYSEGCESAQRYYDDVQNDITAEAKKRMLYRLAVIYHYHGMTAEAVSRYNEIMRIHSGSKEASASKIMVRFIEHHPTADVNDNKHSIDIQGGNDGQESSYREGLEKLSGFNITGAIRCFEQVYSSDKESEISFEAGFRRNVCISLTGADNGDNIKELENTVSENNRYFFNVRIYQAIIYMYLRNGDFPEAMLLLKDINDRPNIFTVSYMVSFLESVVNKIDVWKARKNNEDTFVKNIGDTGGAAGKINDPAEDLEYIPVLDETVQQDKRPGLGEIIVSNIIPQHVQDLITEIVLKITVTLVQTLKESISRGDYNIAVGDYPVLELTEERFNNYIKFVFAAGKEGSFIDNVKVEFGGLQKLRIKCALNLTKKTRTDLTIEGTLNMVGLSEYPYEGSFGGKSNYIIYNVTKSRMGKLPIPANLINVIVKPGIIFFNNEFPLNIREFGFDRDTLRIAGTISKGWTSEKIAESQGWRLQEEKSSDSGFLYAAGEQGYMRTGLGLDKSEFLEDEIYRDMTGGLRLKGLRYDQQRRGLDF